MTEAQRQRKRRGLPLVDPLPPTSSDPVLAEALALIATSRHRPPHSPAYGWMETHRAALEQQFAASGNRPWRKLAVLLTEAGIMGDQGKPPTALSLRSAWALICKRGT